MENMRFIYPRVQGLSTSNRYDPLDKEDTQEGIISRLQKISKRKNKEHSYEDTNTEDNEDCRKDYNSSNSITAGDYYQITKIHRVCMNKNTNCSGYPLCFNNPLLCNKIITNNNISVKVNNSNLNIAPSCISNSDTQIINSMKSIDTTTSSTETIPIFNTCDLTSTKISVNNGAADAQKAPVAADLIEVNNIYIKLLNQY